MNKLLMFLTGLLILIILVATSFTYFLISRKEKKEKEIIGKQMQITETYDDSVVLEGRVIYITYDEYDHPYLAQRIHGSTVYIPYTFVDQPDEMQVDPVQPYYVNNNTIKIEENDY